VAGTSALLGRRASYAEYLALADSLRAEYVNGEVLVAPPRSYAHQRVVQRVWDLLVRIAPPALVAVAVGWQVTTEPPHIRVPDVAVLGREPAGDLITEAPLVAIEVLSTNRSDDLVRKSAECRVAGVGQYWIIDPRDEVLDIFAGTPAGWEPLVHLTRDAPVGTVSIAEFGTVQLSLSELLDVTVSPELR